MANFEDIPPLHLEEQVLVSLNTAIYKVYQSLGNRAKEFDVKVDNNYEEAFKQTFVKLRMGVTSMMTNKSGYSFDGHKLAAIACLAVLISRPIIVSKNGEGHCVNEMVAFYLAVYIMRDYQLKRACGNILGKRVQVYEQLQALSVPDLIYEHRTVSECIVCALRYLSRALKKSEPLDIAPLMSAFNFYIDAYSYQSVQDIAAAVV